MDNGETCGVEMAEKATKIPEQNVLTVNIQRAFRFQVRCRCGRVLGAELMVPHSEHEDEMPMRVVCPPCPKCQDAAHAQGFRDALMKGEELRTNVVNIAARK